MKHNNLLLLFWACVAILAFTWAIRTPSPVQAQAVPIASLADITCDGSAHALDSGSGARWLQIIALSSNAADVRIGDSNVSATRGAPIAPGGGLFLTLGNSIAISSVNYFCSSADKLSVIWGN